MKKITPVKHIDIPGDVYWDLSEDEKTVIKAYIEKGGIGWHSALDVQDELWESHKGRSIDILRSALDKAGYDVKQILSMHHCHRLINKTNPNGLLVRKEPEVKRNWFTKLMNGEVGTK